MTLQDLLVSLRFDTAEWEHGIAQAQAEWSTFSSDLLKGGAALSAVFTAPIAALGKMSLEMGQHFQSAELGFSTMMGSAQLAKGLLEDLRDFAAQTPFEFKDLVTSAKRMMALGFAAQDVIPSLRAIGNAAAGLGGGAALIDRLVLALGQMRAKGKVSAEEMRQLAEAGIPAWEMLAKTIGVGIPEAMKMAEKGVVSAAVAVPALIQGMNEKFGGLMEGFSKTAMGQFSNLKDTLGFILADIGKAIMPLASLFIERFAIPAAEKLKEVAQAFTSLSDTTKTVAIAFAAMAAAAGPLLLLLGGMSMGIATIGPAIGGLVSSVGWFIGALGNIATALSSGGLIGALTLGETALLAFGAIAGTVAAAVAAAWVLWQIPAVQAAIKNLGSLLSDFWTGSIWPAVTTAGALLKSFADTFTTVVTNLASSGLSALWDEVAKATKEVKDQFDSLVTSLRPLGDAWSHLVEAVKPLQPYLEDLSVALLKIEAWATSSVVVWVVERLIKSVTEAIDIVTFFANLVIGAWKSAIDGAVTAINALVKVFDIALLPTLKSAVNGIVSFLDWIMKIPGAKQVFASAGASFDELKKHVELFWGTLSKKPATPQDTGIVSPGSAQAIAAAKKEVAEAKQAVAALLDKMNQGANVTLAYAEALKKVEEATRKQNATIDAAGLSQERVRAAYSASTKELTASLSALENVRKARATGNATADQEAAAQSRVTAARASADAAMKLASERAKALGVDLRDVIGVQETSAKTVTTLEQAHKALAEALKDAKLKQDALLNSYNKAASAQKDADAAVEEAKAGLWAGGDAADKYQAALLRASAAAKTVEGIQQQLSASTLRVQEIQDNLNPEKVLQRQAESVTALEARYADLDKQLASDIKFVEEFGDKWDAAGTAANKAATQTSLAFLKAFDEISKAASKEVEIKPIPAPSFVGMNAAALTPGDVLKAQGEAYAKLIPIARNAFHQMGLYSVDSYQAQADAAQNAANTIIGLYDTGLVKYLDVWRAEKAAAEAQITAEIAAGRKVSQALKDRLKEAEKEIKNHTVKVGTLWKDMVADIKQTFIQIGSAIGSGLFSALLGSDRRAFNKGLDEQAAELRKSLDERTKEWETFQADIAKQQEDLRKKAKADLTVEEGKLQKSLEDRTVAWKQYQANAKASIQDISAANAKSLRDDLDVVYKSLAEQENAYAKSADEIAKAIDAARSNSASDLNKGLSELRQALADRLSEYESYSHDVRRQEADLSANYGRELTAQLSELSRSLADAAREYESFVQDANRSMSRLGQDYQKKVADETKSVKSALADRKKAYDREVEDGNARIAELQQSGGKGSAKEIADVKLSLKRKKEDYDQYVQETTEGLAAFTTDAQTQLAREEQDLNESLKKRTDEWNKYQKDTADKEAEVRNALASKYADDLAALKRNLADKQAELDKFSQDNAGQQKKLSDENAAALAAEIAGYRKSFAEKTDALNQYRADSVASIAEITRKHQEDLNTQVQAVVDALDAEKTAYDDFYASILGSGGALDQLRQKYKDDLAAGEADLAASLASRKAEYEKFVADTTAQLEILKEKHRTLLGDIGGMFANILTRAAEALAGSALGLIFKKMWEDADIDSTMSDNLKKIGEGIKSVVTTIAKGIKAAFEALWEGISSIASSVKSAFTGISKAATDTVSSISQVTQATQQLPSASEMPDLLGGGGSTPTTVPSTIKNTSGSSTGLGGISGITNMVTGAVSAVSGIVSNVQFAHMNTALGRIEESTRGMKNILLDMMHDVLLKYMPGIDGIQDRLIEVGNTVKIYGTQIQQVNEDGFNHIGALLGSIYNVLVSGFGGGGVPSAQSVSPLPAMSRDYNYDNATPNTGQETQREGDAPTVSAEWTRLNGFVDTSVTATAANTVAVNEVVDATQEVADNTKELVATTKDVKAAGEANAITSVEINHELDYLADVNLKGLSPLPVISRTLDSLGDGLSGIPAAFGGFTSQVVQALEPLSAGIVSVGATFASGVASLQDALTESDKNALAKGWITPPTPSGPNTVGFSSNASVAQLAQSADILRRISGMGQPRIVAPLTYTRLDSAAVPTPEPPVLQADITVNLDGRQLGNSFVQNLALQGVRP